MYKKKNISTTNNRQPKYEKEKLTELNRMIFR